MINKLQSSQGEYLNIIIIEFDLYITRQIDLFLDILIDIC